MTPYAYTIGRDRPRLFPTLDAVVRYLISEDHLVSRYRHSWQNTLRAHVVGVEEPQEVDLSAYMERVAVDEAALRAEQVVAVADDLAAFQKTYPHGRPPGARFSGDHWLCESSPEELEARLAREVESRSWQWKPLS